MVNALLEGGNVVIDSLVAKGISVDAAFWAYPSDEERWRLYIATPSARQPNWRETYRAVSDVVRAHPYCGIESSEIDLIPSDDPMAVDAKAHAIPAPHKHPLPYRGRLLGRTYIEGAYIYSPRSTATAAA
jgi:hypothetical protein